MTTQDHTAALLWTAATLQCAVRMSYPLRRQDRITMEGEARTVDQILDAADKALDAAPPPQQSAQGQAIYDAIDILTAEADSLRECHTSGDAKDDWTGEPEAKAEYDRMMRTVEGLRAMSAAQGDAAQGGGNG